MNLRESIRRILREDRTPSNFLRRRLDMLDYEIESNIKTFSRSNICKLFISDEEFFETIMENVIDNMYFNYFSNMDDNSGEWINEYNDMVDYIRNEHKDKIIRYYNNKCG